MDLTERKYIKNTGLPKFADGGPTIKDPSSSFKFKLPEVKWGSTEDILSGSASAVGTIGQLYTDSRPQYTSDEIADQTNKINASSMGVGFTKKAFADYDDYVRKNQGASSTLKGAAGGAMAGASIAGGWGAAIGGIVGGIGGFLSGNHGKSKDIEAWREANRQILADNKFAEHSARTLALQLKELVANGRPPKFAEGREPDAMVSPGEVVVGERGVWQVPGRSMYADGRPNKKDNVPVTLGRSGVISNNIGPDGIPNSEYAMATGDIEGAFARDSYYRKSNGMYAKNGKLPRFAEGWLGNFIPSMTGMAMSLGLYIDGSRLRVKSPSTYVANPYAASALNDLAGLRINQYPIMDQINSARARADYAVDASGGLSAGQRAVARTANLATTQRSIVDSLTNIQAQNNAYRAQLANAKMSLGQQAAQSRQQASQYDLDYYSKAHAAREKYKQIGMQNFLAQLQGYYANEFKRRQFNDTMNLYRLDVALKKELLEAMYPEYYNKKLSTFNPYRSYIIPPTTSLNPYATKSYIDGLLKRAANARFNLR